MGREMRTSGIERITTTGGQLPHEEGYRFETTTDIGGLKKASPGGSFKFWAELESAWQRVVIAV